jgi:prophage antirepressor-like protein
MRDRILQHLGRWLTTSDVARMLGVTADGVRWLTNHDGLTCERTHSGQRLFSEREVLRVVEQRAKARIRSRQELLATVRPQMVRAGLAPRQARFRLVRSGK